MARRVAPEMTIEEYDAWATAHRHADAVAERADEPGGPRLSLVPVAGQQDAWPTDLLAPTPDSDPGATAPRAASLSAAAPKEIPPEGNLT